MLPFPYYPNTFLFLDRVVFILHSSCRLPTSQTSFASYELQCVRSPGKRLAMTWTEPQVSSRGVSVSFIHRSLIFCGHVPLRTYTSHRVNALTLPKSAWLAAYRYSSVHFCRCPCPASRDLWSAHRTVPYSTANVLHMHRRLPLSQTGTVTQPRVRMALA
jgi:hypothetical protein